MTSAQTKSDLKGMLMRFLDAWNAHDVDKVLSFLTEDVVWIEPGVAQPVFGKDAVRKSLENTFTAFPDLHWPKEDIRVYAGDNPLFAATSWTSVGSMQGRMAPGFAPTGKRMRMTGACLYEIRDGLIARHTILYDGVTAMQQLGLMPADSSLMMKAQTLLQNADVAIRGMLKR